MTTGKELAKYRRSLGIKIADIARQLGVGVESLRRIEAGGRQRVRGLVERYEAALNLRDTSWQASC